MTAARLMAILEAQRVTHVIGLPDNATAALIAAVRSHPRMRWLSVTREGEAFAVASGLWLGGAHPVVVVQNTGLLESGDALRGTAVRMGVPLVMLVGYRGYATLDTADIEGGDDRRLEDLTRADVDSVALITEPTLRAWGIPYARLSGDDEPIIAGVFGGARIAERPAAVLLPGMLT